MWRRCGEARCGRRERERAGCPSSRFYPSPAAPSWMTSRLLPMTPMTPMTRARFPDWSCRTSRAARASLRKPHGQAWIGARAAGMSESQTVQARPPVTLDYILHTLLPATGQPSCSCKCTSVLCEWHYIHSGLGSRPSSVFAAIDPLHLFFFM